MSDEMSFLTFLQSFRRGTLLAYADAQLEELMEAIHETGGNGKLTLEFPFKVNKAGQIECQPQVKLTKPKTALGTGVYYTTPSGRLTRKDPLQYDIEDHIAKARDVAAE
jgi:hypothetical protein